MSDLQLSLLAIGAAIIAGVLAYNAMAERKVRRAAEKAFGGEQGDALLDPAARREPTMGGLGEDAGAVAPHDEVIAATDAPLDRSVGPGETGESAITDRIDTVALVLADDPVTAEQVVPFFARLATLEKPVLAEGMVGELWTPVDVNEKRSWRELRFALQLADRAGPVSEGAIARFNDDVAAFCAEVGAVSQREAPALAAARAKELDAFSAEVDIEVAVNVVGRHGATFALSRVAALGLELGLAVDDEGMLAAHDPGDETVFSVRRFERAGVPPEASYATGLTFAMDVPTSSDAPAAFAYMLRTAETFCEKLSGELVDDKRKPLTPAGIGMIKRSLEQVFQRMEAHGIPAGTPAARRLFS
jgi:hypothetical protein